MRNWKLLLASGSPRRRELITQLGFPTEFVNLHEVDETYPANLPASEVAPYLSRLKSDAYHLPLNPDEVLVTADTVVILNGEVIGKPSSEADAREMLRRLAGRTHTVITGVTLLTSSTSSPSPLTFSDVTEVTFYPLTEAEIDSYVSRFHPLDKAGAYGIQEWIGYIGVKSISGCFYNVMGLPLSALYHHLLRL